MGNRFIEKKVPQGKLIKVTVVFSETIDEIRINGDFFLHPESVIEAIEQILTGVPVPITKPEIQTRIDRVLKANKAELVGVTSADLSGVIAEAIHHDD